MAHEYHTDQREGSKAAPILKMIVWKLYERN
jgi:hypothetical protein